MNFIFINLFNNCNKILLRNMMDDDDEYNEYVNTSLYELNSRQPYTSEHVLGRRPLKHRNPQSLRESSSLEARPLRESSSLEARSYRNYQDHTRFAESILSPYLKVLNKLKKDIIEQKELSLEQVKLIKKLYKSIPLHLQKTKKEKINYEDLTNADDYITDIDSSEVNSIESDSELNDLIHRQSILSIQKNNVGLSLRTSSQEETLRIEDITRSTLIDDHFIQNNHSSHNSGLILQESNLKNKEEKHNIKSIPLKYIYTSQPKLHKFWTVTPVYTCNPHSNEIPFEKNKSCGPFCELNTHKKSDYNDLSFEEDDFIAKQEIINTT